MSAITLLLPSTEPVYFKLTLQDFKAAQARVRPSAMRDIQILPPTISWPDIGGQHDVKARLKEAVEWPLQHKQELDRMGL